jgi:hypothetical protein
MTGVLIRRRDAGRCPLKLRHREESQEKAEDSDAWTRREHQSWHLLWALGIDFRLGTSRSAG